MNAIKKQAINSTNDMKQCNRNVIEMPNSGTKVARELANLLIAKLTPGRDNQHQLIRY